MNNEEGKAGAEQRREDHCFSGAAKGLETEIVIEYKTEIKGRRYL